MKRKLLALALMLVLAVSLLSLVACGEDKMEQVTITSVWRDDEFTKAIPKVEFGELFSITDYINHDRVLYIATDLTREDFEGYRADMLAFGYKETKVDETEDSISVEYKREGWRVMLFFGGANINIKVYKK